MLQAPHLWGAGRLGLAAGSRCKALISALGKLHRTEYAASQRLPATRQQDKHAFLKFDPPTLHCFPHSKHPSISLGLHLHY